MSLFKRKIDLESLTPSKLLKHASSPDFPKFVGKTGNDEQQQTEARKERNGPDELHRSSSINSISFGNSSHKQEALKPNGSLQNFKLSCNKPQFSVEALKNNSDSEFESLTGLPSVKSFWQLYLLLECQTNCPNMTYMITDTGDTSTVSVSRSQLYGNSNCFLPIEDELLIVLMKLRLNLIDQDLAQRFGCRKEIIGAVCFNWINFMFQVLVAQKGHPQWPSREKVNLQMPIVFSEDLEFKLLRSLLINVELLGEKPPGSIYETNSLSFSTLQTSKVWTLTIGITPNGAVNFISSLHQGKDVGIADSSLDVFESIQSGLDKDDVIVGPLIPSSTLEQYNSRDVDYIVCSRQPRLPHLVLIRNLATAYMNRLMLFKVLSNIPAEFHSIVHRLATVTMLLTNLNKPILDRDSSHLCSLKTK